MHSYILRPHQSLYNINAHDAVASVVTYRTCYTCLLVLEVCSFVIYLPLSSYCDVFVTVMMLLRGCRRFASSEAVKHARVRHSPKTEHLLDRTLRVDHAGEFGAVQIYKGQLAVLGRSDVAPTLQVDSPRGF